MEDKRPAKENKNEISPGRTAKKYNIGYNSSYTENEKCQNKTTEDRKKVDNKKSLHKDIEQKIKLEKRERQCKSRKNIQKKRVSNEGKNNSVQENINFTHNGKTHVKNVKNYEK